LPGKADCYRHASVLSPGAFAGYLQHVVSFPCPIGMPFLLNETRKIELSHLVTIQQISQIGSKKDLTGFLGEIPQIKSIRRFE